jgi:hypothetical protein
MNDRSWVGTNPFSTMQKVFATTSRTCG